MNVGDRIKVKDLGWATVLSLSVGLAHLEFTHRPDDKPNTFTFRRRLPIYELTA